MNKKLIIVLLGAVLILVLGLSAALLTSCGSVTTTPGAVLVQATAHPTVNLPPTQNGHEMHPWRLQESDGTQPVAWHITTDDTFGVHTWLYPTWTISNTHIVPLIQIASFVLYDNGVYQVWDISVVHHTMKVIRQ